MQIHPRRKRPLDLQDGGLLEKDDFIQLKRRADGSIPPKELRRNQELQKFKLARGEPRLKARTVQEEIRDQARRGIAEINKVVDAHLNGKEFN